MLRAIRLRVLVAGVAAVVATTPAPADDLETLAEVGPWPAVTGLIGYNGRLWFANAVRYPDHNSADVYSLDPARRRGALRASPVQPGRRPSCDRERLAVLAVRGCAHQSRLGPIRGHQRCRLALGCCGAHGADLPRPCPGGARRHADRRGIGLRAGLHESPDFGQRWRQVYDRPTPERRVSRIVELVPHNGALYGSGVDRLAEGLVFRCSGSMAPILLSRPAGRAMRR